MEEAHNLTDRTFIILRKRNFTELTFQEFRSEYSTTFNVIKPPERAKLMKLPIIKVSYSARHKKQIMKIFIEKDYICDLNLNCRNLNTCNKLHCLKSSDRCYLFDRDQTCNNPKCSKLHIPIKSLHKRIIEIFKKSNRSCMPFSKFIVLHRTTYPYLREHHPTNDILSTSEFIDIVKIENTEKTKEIRIIRYDNNNMARPPSLSENIDAPYPALKIIQFDHKWCDTQQLIIDINNLFSLYKIKDIFIPGHSRMAFVTFNTSKNAQNAVKKLNNTWFCGRKVTLSLAINNNNDNDEEKVPLSSSRIVIKAINTIISSERISEWLCRIGSINNIWTCFNKCNKGSNIAYIHFKSQKIINEILTKEKKNNYIKIFRNKQIKLQFVDDGYTDSCAYYSLKNKKNSEHKNNNIYNKRRKTPPNLFHSISLPTNHNKRERERDDKKQNNDQNDSMQLLVMRLKSLINTTISTEKELENKLKVINKISSKCNNNNNNNNNIDIDIAFGDEKYTINAIKDEVKQLKNDKNQINVYKQALTAFETSQSRSISKNQRELKPICEKEIKLAKNLQSVHLEIELLEKQLLLKKNEQNLIKSELEIVRTKVKTLRKNISDMKYKIEPIRECISINKINNLPTDKQIKSIENNLKVSEINMSHWLKWKEWHLKDALQWIGNLENGKFKSDLNKFNALNKISTGSILNAITDPTLQIIGIDDQNDRKIIINQIAVLKSRTAMMNKSIKLYNKKNKKNNQRGYDRTKSLSSTNFYNNRKYNNNDKLKHSLDDISVDAMGQMLRSNSIQSDGINDNNLCVICMDREIAPYAMVPCGHQSLCSICKNLIKPNKHKCPMCNGKVTMIIKLFRS